MSDYTVIIHGWSDCSDSFVDLKKRLHRAGIGDLKTILYADYESREDNITFNDVVQGLNDQFIENGIINPDGTKLKDINVIVHSTGGLIIRQWIYDYYCKDGDRLAQCPIKRLVMLAPANFGSPLAHRGKSFLGSLFKGRWKLGDFLEVGRQLLEGLELASPYQWNLAHQDLLLPKPYYNAQQIQTTILVGNKDYSDFRGWINKPGTDGTVVIAGTSLDSAKVVLDFSNPPRQPRQYVPFNWTIKNPADDFAFGVLPDLDHGSIIEQAAANSPVADYLIEALTTADAAQFHELQGKLEHLTETTCQGNKDIYQQFIVHAVDQFNEPIRDFTMEFFVLKASKHTDGLLNDRRISSAEETLSQQANDAMLAEVHTHTVDPSFRRLLVNLGQMRNLLKQAEQQLGEPVLLGMRVYVPAIDKGIAYDLKSLENVVLYDPSHPTQDGLNFFYPNTTTLVELRVNRICKYVSVSPNPHY
ncbi:MAG: esterase/lipase family protein [Bacillota bacterium]